VSKNFKVKNGLETTNISASSNISASGTISANAINVNGTDVLTSVSGNTFATDLKIGRDADNLIDFTTDNQIQFRVNAGNELKLNNAHLFPAANDGHSLGAAGLAFSDLFLADAAVINFNNGEINLTQTDAALVMSGSGATTLEVLGNVSGSSTSTGSFGNIVGNSISLPNNSISGDVVEGGTIASITISQLGGALDVNNENITNIDVDSGTIDGTVIGGASAAAGTFTTLNATSLNVTSITSSIVTSSILKTEGSNIFGDTAADTHTFNGGIIAGNITSSNNISASGTITAGTLDADAVTDGLAAVIVAEIDNDEIPIAKLAEDAVTVTAGTNLSGGGSITLGGSATLNVDDAFLKNDANDTTSGIITAAGFTTTGNVITNHITASGNISASGTTILNALTLKGLSNQGSEATAVMINGSSVVGTRELGSNAFTSTTIGTTTNALTVDNATLQLNSGTTFNGSAARTISVKDGGIDSDALADNISLTNLTASSNISASGIVTAEGLVISDDALITDDLEVRGNTSGSSTSTGSFAKGFFSAGVGIGTTNPKSTLHVEEGDIRIDTANNATQALRFSDRNTTKAQIQYKDNGETLNILTGGDTNAIEITNAQNVKFSGPITASGNISASGTLDVTGNVNFDGDLDVDGTANLDNIDVDGTANFADNITIAENKAIFFDSTDTFIKANTGTAEDLVISADEDIILAPDDNIQIEHGATTYAEFMGDERKLSITGEISASTGVTTSHITASGNISASGTLIANAITLPNDAISGDKVEGGTIAAITITDLTTTTLNVTHLTSSFVTSSTIITEGSNIFGDAAADTHTFNGGIIAGNITASGNISASGLIVSSLTAGGNLDIGPFNFRTRTLQSDVGTGTIPISISSTTKCTNLNADLLDDQEGSYYTSFLNATGNITASNISASGTIQSTGNITSDGTGSFTDGRFTGNVGIGTTTPQNPLSVSGSLTVFTSNNTSRITVGEADDSGVSTNNILAIEVDGNANKSHTFTVGTGNDYIVETLGNRADIHLSAKGSTKFGVNNGSAYNFTQQMILTGSTGNLGIGTSTPQSKLTVNGDTTTTHITASGNISSSGTITALQYGGNVSGSSTSTGSFGKLLGDGAAISNISATVSGDTFATDLKIGRDSDNHIDFTTDNVMIFNINNASELRLNATALRPHTNNGLALGSTSTSWSDLYLAEGGFITFDNGDAVITQTGPEIELSGSGATRLNVEGEITASGTIIAEHIVSSDDMEVTDDLSVGGVLSVAGDIQHIGDTDTKIVFGTDSITLRAGATELFKVTEASPDTISFGAAISSNITASGNISSSGIITGEGLVISDDALITDDLEVQGNISGSSASTITIGGKLQAGSKSFLISKPEGGKLEYGVLEGQQNDVFFRGELKSDNVIHLPQEWEWLVDKDTITIQLTSIGKHQELFVKEIKDNKIFIGINGMFKTKENIHCYHVIHGTRKDIELIRNHQW